MCRLIGDISADVLVIGLGPAGASAAAAIAKAGHSVIAIDRKIEAGVPVQCAEFVPGMIGQEVGNLEVSRCQVISDMATYVETDEASVTPNFCGSMISRAAFDRNLVFEAESEGAHCHFSSPVRSIETDGTVVLASGCHIRAKFIIGADGPRSLVGRAIGQVNLDCVESRQATVPLRAKHEATDIFLSAAIPGGYGWLFPKKDKANLGLGVAPAFRHLLKPLLERLHRDLAAKQRVGDEVLGITGGAIPVGGLLDPVGRIGDIHVFLAGDAAGLTNPITGAGISAAVMSGASAGQAVSAMLDGRHQAGIDYRDELEDLFGPALRRALKRRQAVMAHYARGKTPTSADLRAAWIAYPQYWAA